jgi:RNA polymerase sigma-70 factor (ECF subfamily)
MTDAELVCHARDGHPAAYEQLVRRWSARVLAVCHARVARRDVAEDMAQETLLRGFQALSTLETPEKFGAWLRGIAVRVCLDWIKARQSSQVPFSTLAEDRFEQAITDDDGDHGRRIDRDEDRERLLSEIEALPEDLREVVLLYYYEELTYDDLADLLGVSRATVNARLAKARDLLRRRLASVMR